MVPWNSAQAWTASSDEFEQAQYDGLLQTDATTSGPSATTMPSPSTMDTMTQAQFEQQRSLINSLLLSKVQTLRTTHIVMGTIGIVSALLMMLRIIREARRTLSLQVPLRPRKFDLLRNVHTSEIFPLALAFAIVVQQTVFVGAQGSALQSVLTTGCSRTAQIVFPAYFLLGYTTAVYGVETTIRALKVSKFGSRGRWTNTICAASVSVLLFFTWIPTAVHKSPDRCFGNLLWMPVRYHVVAIGIISVLVFLLISMGIIIMLQLMRSIKVDVDERIGASMVCYYLFLTALTYILILPFFIRAHLFGVRGSFVSSRIAEVVLFGSGIFLVAFHLFLRVNANRMTIKPSGLPSMHKRQRIRFLGPSDMSLTISGPIMSPRSDRDDAGLLGEKSPEHYPTSIKSHSFAFSQPSPNRLDPTTWPLPPNPFSPIRFNSPKSPMRAKSSYSIFPTRVDDVPRLPPIAYTSSSAKASSNPFSPKRATTASEAPSVTYISDAYDGELQPPLPLFANRHRRESSDDSSATVQIGLRLSVAPAAIAAGNITTQNRTGSIRRPALPAHPAVLRRDRSDSSGESLSLSIQKPSIPSSPKESTSTQNVGPAPKDETPDLKPENSGDYLQKAREKVLPPIPRASIQKPAVSAVIRFSGLRMNPVKTLPTMPTIKASPSSSVKSPPATASVPNWF